VTLRSGRSQSPSPSGSLSQFSAPGKAEARVGESSFRRRGSKPISLLTELTEVRGFLPCEDGVVDDRSAQLPAIRQRRAEWVKSIRRERPAWCRNQELRSAALLL
jgi:hypothetical protein